MWVFMFFFFLPGFSAEDVEAISNILLVALSGIADWWQTDRLKQTNFHFGLCALLHGAFPW